jgi:hypothetical protein
MPNELKGCPFCGGETDYCSGPNEQDFDCRKCGASVMWWSKGFTKDEAIAAWNTRADPAQVHISGSPDMPAETRDALAQMIGHVIRNGVDTRAPMKPSEGEVAKAIFTALHGPMWGVANDQTRYQFTCIAKAAIAALTPPEGGDCK